MRKGQLRTRQKEEMELQFTHDDLLPVPERFSKCLNWVRSIGSFSGRGLYLGMAEPYVKPPEIIEDETGCYVVVFPK